MKKIVTFFAILTVSSTVFAGSKDLKVFSTLLKAGASSEQFMSQVHVSLDNVECEYSNISKAYDCNMTDILANEEEGASLVLSGKKAKSVFRLLIAHGAPSDNGMGKVFVSAKSIRCSQAVKGVTDGTAADRTSCTIDISAE
ncbi:MAG: hypothetical protein PHY93_11405 [Bacteriovorax sp.]|nr:hypothetical protein [Bacteriovorax sp.]